MSDLYRIEIELVGLPTPERNSRRHWRTVRKEIQRWRRAVGFAVLGREPPRPLEKAYVRFVRHSAREPDPTNLAESFKAVEDALVVAGIMADDQSYNYAGGKPDVRWQEAPPKRGYITVLVQEVNHDSEKDDEGSDTEEDGAEEIG